MKAINKRLLSEVKPHWGRIIFALLLIFLTAGFQALAPWPFKLLIDNVLGSEQISGNSIISRILEFFSSSKVILSLFAVGVYFASNVLSNVTDYYANIKVKLLSRDIVQSFSRKVFSNLGRMNLRHYREQNIGDYLYRIGYDTSSLGNLFEDGFLPLLTNIAY